MPKNKSAWAAECSLQMVGSARELPAQQPGLCALPALPLRRFNHCGQREQHSTSPFAQLRLQSGAGTIPTHTHRGWDLPPAPGTPTLGNAAAGWGSVGTSLCAEKKKQGAILFKGISGFYTVWTSEKKKIQFLSHLLLLCCSQVECIVENCLPKKN